ncbi:LysR family transcriptional regulator [Pseudomonas mediterranea]|uniref:LysR substrate-binding domain-containing protein n=1 Tax=Pseudomonas TaxID=286 RepID=UPI001317B1D1|nr:LysR substrate-binding domain-containing protein [Pseudomonas mediterranea]QHA82189.1 LysR family transcriptional regulator [Pseudomonas mediterranea]
MELRHLRYFSMLAETLSFTRAAEKSHVTQSTLSHQIKQLEDELGIRLFERIGKKVVITEAGDALLTELQPALRQIDKAIKGLQASPGSVSGELRIGATHTFNSQLVPQCVALFHERFPETKIFVQELSQALIVQQLEAGNLDLGIAYRPLDRNDLWFEPLYNEELLLVVSERHPLAGRKRVRMVELHGVSMVLLSSVYSTRLMLDECFQAAGAEPQVIVEMNSITPMVELIRQSQLAGIVGKTGILDTKGLSFVALEHPTPIRTPGLLWLRGGQSTSVGANFAKILKRQLTNGTED